MSGWMERPVATLGEAFETQIGTFAGRTVSDIIPIVAPAVELGCSIYFIWYAWMIMTGRSRRGMMDFIIEWAKIAVIANVALSVPMFTSLVIDFFSAMDRWLIAAIPMGGLESADTAWSAVDKMILQTWAMVAKVLEVDALFSFANFGAHIVCALMAAGSAIGVFYLAGFGLQLVIINKIMLVILLGLGPLFLCCLMFPATKSLFSGWVKSLLASVLTLVMFTAVAGFLITVTDALLTALFADVQGAGTDALAALGRTVLIFVMICGAGGEIFKWIPVIARNITGAFAVGPHWSAVSGPAARIAGHLGIAAGAVGYGIGSDAVRGAGGAAGGWLARTAADRVSDGTRMGLASAAASEGPIGAAAARAMSAGTRSGLASGTEVSPPVWNAPASSGTMSAGNVPASAPDEQGSSGLAGREGPASGGVFAAGSADGTRSGVTSAEDLQEAGSPGAFGSLAGGADAAESGAAHPEPASPPDPVSLAAPPGRTSRTDRDKPEPAGEPDGSFASLADAAHAGTAWNQPAATAAQKAARAAVRGAGAVRAAARSVNESQLAARAKIADIPATRTLSRMVEGAIARAGSAARAVREDMAERNARSYAPTEFRSDVNPSLNAWRLEHGGGDGAPPKAGVDKPLTEREFASRTRYEESLRHKPHRNRAGRDFGAEAARYSVADNDDGDAD